MAQTDFPSNWLDALRFVKKFKDELWGDLTDGISFSDLVTLFMHLTSKR